MDAAASVVLGALEAAREKLEAAKEAVDVAADVLSVLDFLEVVVLMIPRRGPNAENIIPVEEEEEAEAPTAEPEGTVEISVSGEDEPSIVIVPETPAAEENPTGKERAAQAVTNFCQSAKENLKSEAKEIKEYVAEEIKSHIEGIVNDMIENELPLSLSLSRKGFDLADMGVADMRKLIGAISKEHGIKSITVTFIGLNVCCKMAADELKAVEETISQVDQNVNCTWVFRPWKVMKQSKLHDELLDHSKNIERLAMLIQSAISVASYAVQLEQMENVFDATSAIKNEALRSFWKSYLGRENTLVTISEAQRAFIHHFEDVLQQFSQYDRDPLVYACRRLQDLWDAQRDGQLSIYEFASLSFTSGNGSAMDPIQDTLKIIQTDMKQFTESVRIEITPRFQTDSSITNGSIKLRLNEPVLIRVQWRAPQEWKYFHKSDKIVILPEELQQNPPKNLNEFPRRIVQEWALSDHLSCFVDKQDQLQSGANDCLWTFETTFNFSEMGQYAIALCLVSQESDKNVDETYFGLAKHSDLVTIEVSEATSLFFLNKMDDGKFAVDCTFSSSKSAKVAKGQKDTIYVALHVNPPETEHYRRISLFQLTTNHKSKAIREKEIKAFIITNTATEPPVGFDPVEAESLALSQGGIEELGRISFTKASPIHNLCFPLPPSSKSISYRIQLCPSVATGCLVNSDFAHSPFLLYNHSFFATLPQNWMAPVWMPGGSLEQDGKSWVVSYNPPASVSVDKAGVFTVIGDRHYEQGTMSATHFSVEIVESGQPLPRDWDIENSEHILAVGFTSLPFDVKAIPGAGTTPGVCFMAHDGRFFNSEHKVEIWTKHRVTSPGWTIEVVGDVMHGTAVVILRDPQGREEIASRHKTHVPMLLSQQSWVPFVSLFSPGLKVRATFLQDIGRLPSSVHTPYNSCEDIFFNMPFNSGPKTQESAKDTTDAQEYLSLVGKWILTINGLGLSVPVQVGPKSQDSSQLFCVETQVEGEPVTLSGEAQDGHVVSLQVHHKGSVFKAEMAFSPTFTAFFGLLKPKEGGSAPMLLQVPNAEGCSLVYQWSSSKLLSKEVIMWDEETNCSPNTFKYPWKESPNNDAATIKFLDMFSHQSTAQFWSKNIGQKVMIISYRDIRPLLQNALKDYHEEALKLFESIPNHVLEAAIAGFDEQVDIYEFDLMAGVKGFPLGFEEWLGKLQVKTNDLIAQGIFTRNALQSFLGTLFESTTKDLDAVVADGEADIETLLQLAAAHEKSWDLKKAAGIYRTILDLAGDQCEPSKLGLVLTKAADCFRQISDFGKALGLYNEALSLELEPAIKLVCMFGKAWCLFSTSEFQTSLDLYKESLALSEQLGRQKDVAAALSGIGNCMRSLGQNTEALEHHQKALQIAEEMQDQNAVASYLGNVGLCFKSVGKFQQALENYKKSLQIQEEVGDKWGAAASYGNMGVCFRSLGLIRDALESYRNALKIQEQISDKRGTAATLGNIGVCLESVGQFQDALSHHRRALSIKEDVGDKVGVANSWTNMGNCSLNLGQIGDAVDCHKKALEIREAVGDEKGMAASFTNLGVCFASQGQLEEAMSHYNRSVEIKEKIGDKRGMAAPLGNMAACCHSLQRFQESLDLHKRALAIQEEFKDKMGAAKSLANIMGCLSSLGQNTEALEYSHQAIKVQQEIGDKFGEGTTWFMAGTLHKGMDNYGEACECFERSVKIRETLGNKQNLAFALCGAGDCQDALEQKDEAAKTYKRAVKLLKEIGMGELAQEIQSSVGLEDEEETSEPVTLKDLIGDGSFTNREGEVLTFEDAFGSAEAIGVYFSANWCPACQIFTPKLVEIYSEVKKSHNKFQIIFGSYDQGEKFFKAYSAEMPWVMFPFRDPRIQALATKFGATDLPTLIIVNAKGEVKTMNGHAPLTAKGADAVAEWL